jgi:hypothetical protein
MSQGQTSCFALKHVTPKDPYMSKTHYLVEHISNIRLHDGITVIVGGLKLKTQTSCGFWWYGYYAYFRKNACNLFGHCQGGKNIDVVIQLPLKK